MIEFQSLDKSFGGHAVLSKITLTLPRTGVTFVVGKSGAGKSVLLKHVVGLLRPDRGDVLLDGQSVPSMNPRALKQLRRRIGMVFQASTLLDSRNVIENVALPIEQHRLCGTRRATRNRAMDLLTQVGMAFAHDHEIAALSAGQRKRVAIARALALSPETLIYDEPTTALDPLSARHIDDVIRTAADHGGMAAIVISHDLASLFRIADRVVMLANGALCFNGAPALLATSADPEAAAFVAHARGNTHGNAIK